jgi:alpha-beta hydrolase superfamily lysophospholipase
MGLARRAFATAIAGTSRALGTFPARALGLGPENEAGEILADWMSWNLRGAWRGADGFDYFDALAQIASPFLAVAGGSDHLFAPPRSCGAIVERIGSRRKALAVHRHLSHRGLLRNPRARERCWPETASWLQESALLS